MAEWLCSGLQLRVHRFDSVLSLHEMRIFITGTAGFIGYHLSRFLLSKGFFVYGIDNLNNYYDLKLKHARLIELEKFKNFSFMAQDLNEISKKELNCDIALNLAAQAGVRLPKEDNWKYDYSNVNGFESFLKFCEFNDINKIIYASSSSVYSGNKEIPFSEECLLSKPSSRYAETKIINENQADKYINNSPNTRIIGLRFFTVYGPWGRPDMAYYLFSEKVINKSLIKLFNDGKTSRDMTNIEDIVTGIYLSMKHLEKSKKRHEIFNLGNSKPVKTSELLNIIEEKLKIEAKVMMVQNQNEPMITKADITKSKNILGYNPQISINEGLEDFFCWYKKYNNV